MFFGSPILKAGNKDEEGKRKDSLVVPKHRAMDRMGLSRQAVHSHDKR